MRVVAIALAAAAMILLVFVAGYATASRLARQDETTSGAVTAPDRVDRVDVGTDSAAVEVVAARVEHVRAEFRLTWSTRKPRVEKRVEGRTLRLRVRCPAVTIGKGCGGTVRLTVPPDTEVIADSSAGGVTVDGVSRAVRASSAAGGVSVRGVAGPLVLESDAGGVTGTRLRAAQVVATSSAGDVDLSFASQPASVEARSTAGDVVIEVPRGGATYKVDARTTAGDSRVDVDTDATSSRTLTASSSAGDVDVTYPS